MSEVKTTATGDKGLYAGLMRLHVLQEAKQGKICGAWVTDQLRNRGYEISPGTLYPMLHGLEQKGYLSSHKERVRKTMRRIYVITSRGEAVLEEAKGKVQELFGDLFETPK